MSISAYPLQWPDHIERSKARETGQFRTTLSGALENVRDSLRRFGSDSGKAVANVVISSNVTLGENRPSDPGVAVWFTWDGVQVCIPVDRYAKPEGNLQAIHHIVEARRTELRHGTLALVRASFRGFQALPAPDGARKRPWRTVMGFNDAQHPTRDHLDRVWKTLAKERHPDAGGTAAAMAELNAARAEALKEIG